VTGVQNDSGGIATINGSDSISITPSIVTDHVQVRDSVSASLSLGMKPRERGFARYIEPTIESAGQPFGLDWPLRAVRSR
jgi:hypothetical protein